MWQRSYGFFDCTYVFRTTQRNLSLFHQILIAIPTSLRNNRNVHKCLVEKYSNQKKRLFFVELSQCLKEFRYCASGPRCFKIVNFCRTGVEFRQQSIGDLRISQATLYDVARRNHNFWSTYSLTHSLTYSQSHVWRQTRCLKTMTNYCY